MQFNKNQKAEDIRLTNIAAAKCKLSNRFLNLQRSPMWSAPVWGPGAWTR